MPLNERGKVLERSMKNKYYEETKGNDYLWH